MSVFRDVTAEQRFEEGFADDQGQIHTVFADYAIQGDSRLILHVEAASELRGSGAAGRFMQSLSEHARREGLKLTPRCGYAVAWFKRHPEAANGVVSG